MTKANADTWPRRIERAEQLASEEGPASSLLGFYVRLLREQKAIGDALDVSHPTGSLEVDSQQILGCASGLLLMVARSGPEQLATDARALLDDSSSVRGELLLTYWQTRSDRLFFAKALLQPYAEWLARRRRQSPGSPATTDARRCPGCGGAPQLSVLDSAGEIAVDGGSRRLQCATCLTSWPFRRVLCPACGNDDERTLGYFGSPTFPYLRVDVCERCRHYLKSIDLGRLGLAVPLVDEVAGAPLDLWAREHGYEKIELNLVGL